MGKEGADAGALQCCALVCRAGARTRVRTPALGGFAQQWRARATTAVRVSLCCKGRKKETCKWAR
eukprot:88142-Chlamydomonas_euryale.AAC.1